MTVTRCTCFCIILSVNVWIGENNLQTCVEENMFMPFQMFLPYGYRGNDTVECYSQNSQLKKSVTLHFFVIGHFGLKTFSHLIPVHVYVT